MPGSVVPLAMFYKNRGQDDELGWIVELCVFDVFFLLKLDYTREPAQCYSVQRKGTILYPEPKSKILKFLSREEE